MPERFIMRRLHRVIARTAALPLATAIAVLGSGCSSASTGTSASAAPSSTGPISVTNCGFDVTLEHAPERIVSVKSTSTELLLALGLEDHIVGTAFQDGPVPDEYAAAAAELTVISEQAPGQEAVLALEPDMIYSGWESTFSTDGVGDRAALDELGVASYVSPAACKEPASMPDPMTFDLLFDEFTEAGEVFGAEDAAAELVETQQSALAAIEPNDDGLTALWYSSGTDTPYVGAGIGAPQMVMDAAGLTNVAADVDDTWTSMGWESIIDADPDVIVLIDADWNTAQSKIDALESNPVTANISAVRTSSYVTIPFPASEAGVRSVDAAASIVEQLDELGR